MKEMRVEGTGVNVPVPATKMPGVGHARIPDFNGEHLWTVVAGWKVDPKTFVPGASVFLDTENLITVSGIGCLRTVRERR